jgi:hypothetical protein
MDSSLPVAALSLAASAVVTSAGPVNFLRHFVGSVHEKTAFWKIWTQTLSCCQWLRMDTEYLFLTERR